MPKNSETKGLDGMIRLHKWQLDEKRRELSGLEAMREDLLHRKASLEEEIAREQKVATTEEVSYAYAGFANAAIVRRRKLEGSVREIEQTINAKKDEIHESFQELKKFEILAERRRAQAAHTAAKREQAEFDEISLNIHRRAKSA